MMLLNYMTRDSFSIGIFDLAIALGPFVIGVLLWPVGRWVMAGRWRRSEIE
jgi:hypothetical protein